MDLVDSQFFNPVCNLTFSTSMGIFASAKTWTILSWCELRCAMVLRPMDSHVDDAFDSICDLTFEFNMV